MRDAPAPLHEYSNTHMCIWHVYAGVSGLHDSCKRMCTYAWETEKHRRVKTSRQVPCSCAGACDRTDKHAYTHTCWALALTGSTGRHLRHRVLMRSINICTALLQQLHRSDRCKRQLPSVKVPLGLTQHLATIFMMSYDPDNSTVCLRHLQPFSNLHSSGT